MATYTFHPVTATGNTAPGNVLADGVGAQTLMDMNFRTPEAWEADQTVKV